MSPLEGDRKTSPPLVALLVRGRQVLPSPGGGLRTYLVHRWQAAGLYLEQSVSLEGKGNATVSRGTLGHLSISIWHRRAQGQRNRGGGAFPTRTRTRLTERKVSCPNRYQHLPGSVGGGDIPGARHSGSGSTAWQRAQARGRPALGHGVATWGQEQEPLTKTDLSWPGTANPAATALQERKKTKHFCLR